MNIPQADHCTFDIVEPPRTPSARRRNGVDRLISLARVLSAAALVCAVAGCGSDSKGRGDATAQGGTEAADPDCNGSCPNLTLAVSEQMRIIQQGIAAAQSMGVNATFAIVDRVGNVLSVYQMQDAPATTTVDGRIGAVGGLEGATVPATAAAISKAGTGAFLSSQGNAFTTRTASQIVEEHFDPGELEQAGGPLFGVQFSQLLCSDVMVLDTTASGKTPSGTKSRSATRGPRPLPLGLSADPGGFPIYKSGDLVGGIGVEFDGKYSLDRDISDDDNAPEEIVALAALRGFDAPATRTANNIIVGGHTLRYSDISLDEIPPPPETLPVFDPSRIVAVPPFFSGIIHDGVAFGNVESGILTTTRAGVAAMVLVDEQGAPRFPTRGGARLPNGSELTPTEVDALLDSAFLTSHRARAAIRRPLDSAALVSIFVIDTNGTPLGFVRSDDAPIFGIDVSLQKARTALVLSQPDAHSVLDRIGATGANGPYGSGIDAFIGREVLDGSVAFTCRAIGNLARPFFPDGIDGNPAGPASLPFPPLTAGGRSWSPFNDGMQLDLVAQRLLQPLGIPVSPPPSLPDSCTGPELGERLRNGFQIFAGSVPLYRNGALIGAIGVSGDGIDQDDMVSFLGASRKGLDFAGHPDVGDPVLGFNAPPEIRVDRVRPQAVPGTNLRYVNCPEGPFIDSNEQNVCEQ